jgi:hypothetical protein
VRLVGISKIQLLYKKNGPKAKLYDSGVSSDSQAKINFLPVFDLQTLSFRGTVQERVNPYPANVENRVS